MLIQAVIMLRNVMLLHAVMLFHNVMLLSVLRFHTRHRDNLLRRFMDKINRNDVVFLRSPQDPREFLIKRVTKLEGEDISRDIAGSKPWVPW